MLSFLSNCMYVVRFIHFGVCFRSNWTPVVILYIFELSVYIQNSHALTTPWETASNNVGSSLVFNYFPMLYVPPLKCKETAPRLRLTQTENSKHWGFDWFHIYRSEWKKRGLHSRWCRGNGWWYPICSIKLIQQRLRSWLCQSFKSFSAWAASLWGSPRITFSNERIPVGFSEIT